MWEDWMKLRGIFEKSTVQLVCWLGAFPRNLFQWACTMHLFLHFWDGQKKRFSILFKTRISGVMQYFFMYSVQIQTLFHDLSTPALNFHSFLWVSFLSRFSEQIHEKSLGRLLMAVFLMFQSITEMFTSLWKSLLKAQTVRSALRDRQAVITPHPSISPSLSLSPSGSKRGQPCSE